MASIYHSPNRRTNCYETRSKIFPTSQCTTCLLGERIICLFWSEAKMGQFLQSPTVKIASIPLRWWKNVANLLLKKGKVLGDCNIHSTRWWLHSELSGVLHTGGIASVKDSPSLRSTYSWEVFCKRKCLYQVTHSFLHVICFVIHTQELS